MLHLLTRNCHGPPCIVLGCAGVELGSAEEEHVALAEGKAVGLPHHQQPMKGHCQALHQGWRMLG